MALIPGGPFSFPHPAFWKFIFALSIFYEVSLIFLLFQSTEDARQWMKVMDEDLGEPIDDKDYGSNCLIYDSADKENPWHNLLDKLDPFIIVHFFGHWFFMLQFRDWRIVSVISVMFEFLEYSLEHQLPNFHECWWDHWLLDVVICNSVGSLAGVLTLQWLTSSRGWIMFAWNPFSSFRRWVGLFSLIFILLMAKLNSFYLKFVLWIPVTHIINVIRLLFMLTWGSVGTREAYQLLDDSSSGPQVAPQLSVLIVIIFTEVLIFVKFGWSIVTKPPPRHIGACWLIGCLLAAGITLAKFYVTKPKLSKLHKKQRMAIVASFNHLTSPYKDD